jgi:hypothetical protein
VLVKLEGLGRGTLKEGPWIQGANQTRYAYMQPPRQVAKSKHLHERRTAYNCRVRDLNRSMSMSMSMSRVVNMNMNMNMGKHSTNQSSRQTSTTRRLSMRPRGWSIKNESHKATATASTTIGPMDGLSLGDYR